MKIIKKYYKKIILGLSLCLSLFIGIFAVNNVNADSLEYDNGYSINTNANDVFYSNTINISNTKQYDLSMPIIYTLNDNDFYTEFTTSNVDTDNYGYQVICNFDFINKYIINNYSNYNFIPYSNIIVSISFDIEMEMYDVGNDAWNYEQLNLIADSPYNMNGLLYEGDFYDCFGIVNTYASELVEISSEEGNYFYLDSNGYTINAIFVLNYNDYSTQSDWEDLNTFAFGFDYNYYVSNGLKVKFNIHNLDIGNDSIYYYLMNKYKSDYVSKSQQYDDYVENHTYSNNQYNTLNDNYNGLENDYNVLQNNYNQLSFAYNSLINGVAPFKSDNILGSEITSTNIGHISNDYLYAFDVFDNKIVIDSSGIRDIVDAYQIQQSSNICISFNLILKDVAFIPYLECKANSTDFDYDFIFVNDSNIVWQTNVDSNSGSNADGLSTEYVDIYFNQVIINIYNVNNSHYADSNSYMLTSISYFDGYSQAIKDMQPKFDRYENEISSLNDTISGNTATINILKNQVANLEDAVNDNLGWASLFLGMADTPLKVVHSVLGFELFGLNLFTTFIGIITICAIVYVLKKFF